MITTWNVQCFPSGTMIVKSNMPGPWFYIYGPGGDSEMTSERNRYRCCIDVRDFMNGGLRPPWLDDMQRVAPSLLADIDGTSIAAVGPMGGAGTPGSGNWKTDESKVANESRANLIERLLKERGE